MRFIRAQYIGLYSFSGKIWTLQNYNQNNVVPKLPDINLLASKVRTRPMSMKCPTRHYDIIISGGGMVGFAAGCALGSSSYLKNKKILVLEKQKDISWHLPNHYNNRVSALNDHTINLFKQIKVWDHVKALRAQPVKQMQVWESCSEAMITFGELHLHEPVAHIVENDVILHSLKKQLPENVEVSYESKISSFDLPKTIDSFVKVIFEDGGSITADLLIGADGANSQVRKSMGSKYLTWEYDQMGIVATLHLSEEQENFVAWQKFIATGPIAFLPLSTRCSSLVWSTTRENCKQLLSLSEEDFIDTLNNTMWKDEFNPLVTDVHDKWQNLLQTLLPTNHTRGVKQLPPSFSKIVPKSRAAFPLGLGHAAHYVRPRVALVGDAAHRVHPLAGQGVNLGFGDVSALQATLENAVKLGCDIGDESELHHYESVRQKHNVISIAAMDSIYRLYSTQSTPLVLLRSLGLTAVDAITPLKKRIMAHAEGQTVQCPSLNISSNCKK